MSIRDIKQALVATIESIPNIGRVHNRMRRLPRTPTQQDVQNVFGIEDQTSERGWSIRTWMWYRQGRLARRETLDNQVWSFTHHMVLQGYVEINDAYDSETEWNALCDAITQALQPREEAPLLAWAQHWSLPELRIEADATIVGLYECHDAELRMDVEELINNSDPDQSVYLHTGVWNL